MTHTPFRTSRRGFIGGTLTAAVGGFAAGLSDAHAHAFGGQSLTPALSLDAIKSTGQPDEAYWWKVRSQFNVVDGLTYMNNGTLGPMPRVVFDANERYMREIMEDPTNSGRAEEIDKVREKVAQFVGATADEIALTRSTTEGMNVFAHGFNWKAGDEVLYCTHEHGGGTGPYKTLEKRVGIKIVTVEIPSPPQSVDQIVGLFEKAITPMRSFMIDNLQHGRLFLAGDAAHIVPPTGGKGLNLAVADIKWLVEAFFHFYKNNKKDLLQAYTTNALRRVWRAQDFSNFMTYLFHKQAPHGSFEYHLQKAKFDYIRLSKAYATTIAENYVGLKEI